MKLSQAITFILTPSNCDMLRPQQFRNNSWLIAQYSPFNTCVNNIKIGVHTFISVFGLQDKICVCVQILRWNDTVKSFYITTQIVVALKLEMDTVMTFTIGRFVALTVATAVWKMSTHCFAGNSAILWCYKKGVRSKINVVLVFANVFHMSTFNWSFVFMSLF